MNERKEWTWVDWVGIGLFGVGSFGAVLMLLAMSHSAPLARSSGTAAIASAWAQAIGVFPSIVWNAAIAFLGAKLFLQGNPRGLGKNLLGVTGLALAMSVLVGAFNPTAGGAVGEHTGAVVAQSTHFVLGALLGLVVAFAVAWLTWLREPSMASPRPVQPAPETAPAARRVVKSAAPGILSGSTSSEGVTAAESAALFPEEEPEPEVRRIEVQKAPNAVKAMPPSPYPEDVRLKGKIPPGARPLETNAAAANEAQAPSAYRWTAPGTASGAGESRRESAVPNVAVPAGARAFEPEAGIEARPMDEEEIAGAENARTDLAEAAEADAAAQKIAEPLAPVPAPSWEQPELFAPEVDEEPVDAYGTPLSLVEQLRLARKDSGLESVQPESVQEEEAEMESTSAVLDTAELPIDVEELDIDIQAAADEDDEDFVEEESEEEGEADEDDEDDEDEEEDELDEDEELDGEDIDEDALAAEGDAPAEDEGYEVEVAVSAVITTLEPDARESNESSGADMEPTTTVARSEPVVEAKPASAPVPAPVPAQADLFDEPRAKPPQETSRPRERKEPREPVVAAKPTNSERDVVLQPKAASPRERAEKQPASFEGRKQLLADVGCLFVDRGRVAVSMLQRQYSMDFDDACKVLDELQELGLIGPYLGGQRRDILLTRDQWLEKVSGS